MWLIKTHHLSRDVLTFTPLVASNFTVYDYTNPTASANSIAIIDCGKSMCPDPSSNPVAEYNAEPAMIPCAVSDAYKCTKPTFRLNRTLINLPIINLTADAAHSQVESGECKIVSDPRRRRGIISSNTDWRLWAKQRDVDCFYQCRSE